MMTVSKIRTQRNKEWSATILCVIVLLSIPPKNTLHFLGEVTNINRGVVASHIHFDVRTGSGGDTQKTEFFTLDISEPPL